MSDQVTPAHSDEVWAELCSKTIELVPKAIGHDAWVLIIASTLITSPSPELLGEFSAFLTRCRPEFSTDEAQKSLSLRLRAVCLKLLTIVGAPRMLSALMPLAKSEGDVMVKGEHSVLSDKWSNINVPEIHARGTETIHSIYDPHFLPRIFAQWGSHKEDVKFSILVAVYGLYLSDFESISAVETEAVVFASIMCQGLRGPALWHMRGMGRMLGARGGEGDGDHHHDRELGAIKDQLRSLKVALIGVVEFVGDEYVRRAAVEAWCNVGDVQRELGGWGEDSR